MRVCVIKTSVTALVLFLITPLFSYAQSVTITPNPRYPEAGERVNFTLDSFGLDFADTLVTWRKGGQVVSSGVNNTFYTDIIPQNQQDYLLSVEVLYEGKRLTDIFNITPFNVDLFWEVKDGYTPPFYKGKTLPVRQSNILLNAVADGVNPNNTSFTWSKGASSQSRNSGLAKNTFSFVNDLLDQQDFISVLAQSETKAATSQKTISYVSPEIVFYPTDIRGGFSLNDSFDVVNERVTSNTLKLTAIPYFMTIGDTSDPDYNLVWTLNNTKAPQQRKKNVIEINNNKQNVQLNLDVSHQNRIYQTGGVGINFNFE